MGGPETHTADQDAAVSLLFCLKQVKQKEERSLKFNGKSKVATIPPLEAIGTPGCNQCRQFLVLFKTS